MRSTLAHPSLKGRSILPFTGRFLVMLGLLTALVSAPADLGAQDFGVYLKVVEAPEGTVAEVSARAEEAVTQAGWTLLTAYDAGTPTEACSYQARVLVVDWPEHTQVALSQGDHGAFAAPVRIGVYEDELGVHVSAVNPRSINRTIVAEEGMDAEWDRLAGTLVQTVATGMGETPATGEFGRFRDKGRIGRTMGIMAGGPFKGKIKDVSVADGNVGEVAQAVFDALSAGGPGPEWGIRPAYLMTPKEGLRVLGVTGQRMEARSFTIVGKGGDKSRDDMACPGLDHAAAYPVEVLFAQEGGQVKITLVDEMYRMKMFFEDAGRMKFARNMGMPGSIEDEIKDLIRAALVF